MSDTDRPDVKLEHCWDVRMRFELLFVVCDAKVVRMQKLRAWGNIGVGRAVIIMCEKFCRHINRDTLEEWATHYREVTSNELSRGWVISGKCFPKGNSMVTCGMFITAELLKTG